MIRTAALIVTATLLLSAVWTGAALQTPDQGRLTIELNDATTGRATPGIIQLRDSQGQVVILPGLMNRGLGIEQPGPIHDWYVLPQKTTVTVAPGRYTLHALRGIETERSELPVQIERGQSHSVQLPLVKFFDAAAAGLRSGNTHLHLQKLPRVESDRYLVDVPRADGLDVLFVSYLERAEADRDYVTNQYSRDDLRKLSERGVPIGNGEEHRHNFAGWGQGYGHVMFLDLPRLVLPVSIGPGIMKTGNDGRPLRLGIDDARRQGALIIWCHDQWGYEDIPNWIMGRLQANNIFDGGTHGSYQHSFYRYLNAGLKVPFSTGTDWFQYDFSRVYIPAATPPTPAEFLAQLVQGRSTITNGPLLELRIDGRAIGETIELAESGKIVVEAKGRGRVDFGRLELIRNGQIVQQTATQPRGKHFEAASRWELDVNEPCWIALRTPPPPVKNFADLQTPVAKNELGNDVFAHTSAVYVKLNGRGVFDASAAGALLAEMQEQRRIIASQAKIETDQERQQVLGVYDEAIAAWTKRIAERQ